MNLIDRFESFVERLMERTFTRAAGSHLQPVEIGKRLVRVMEAEQSVGMEGVLVPNAYDVFLSKADYEHFEGARGSMAKNLESHLGRIARQRRFHMIDRPLVTFHVDDEVDSGDLAVEAQMMDIESDAPSVPQYTSVLPQVENPTAPRAGTPNLIWENQSYAVLRSPTKIGRLADNDIVLSDKRVSRHHAELVQQSGRWVVRDTGSTNGTALNGKMIKEAPLKPGDKVSLGGLEIVWDQ
ncbi:MAG TPA: DUF3662 and FHA domain-containing protein [Chloroflexota bacterium]